MFFLKDLPTRHMIAGYGKYLQDGGEERAALALKQMRDASLLLRDLEKYFASHQLSQLQFLVMIVIDREPERTALTMGEISERLDVSKPVLSRTVATLVEKGLLMGIIESGGDKRAKHMTLTDTATSMLARVLPGYFELLTRAPPD